MNAFFRALFAGTIDAILTLPFEIFSTENLGSDIFQGCFVVTCTLFAFAGLVWLREQILHGGGPEWLQRDAGGHQEDQPRVLDNVPEEGRIEGEEDEPQVLEPGNDVNLWIDCFGNINCFYLPQFNIN